MPTGVAVDSKGNIYIADSDNNRIRRPDATGVIRTIAGTGENGFGGDEGVATAAKLSFPRGITLDSQGNLYIADRQNSRVRVVGVDGRIRTVIGSGERGYNNDGSALKAKLDYPQGVAVGPDNAIYVADSGNHRIRKLEVDGSLKTIAERVIGGRQATADRRC